MLSSQSVPILYVFGSTNYPMYQFVPTAIFSPPQTPAERQRRAALLLSGVARRCIPLKAYQFYRRCAITLQRFWRRSVACEMQTFHVFRRFRATNLTMRAVKKLEPSQVHSALYVPCVSVPLKHLTRRLLRLCRDLEKVDTLKMSPFFRVTDPCRPSVFALPSDDLAGLRPSLLHMAYVAACWPIMMYKHAHSDTHLINQRALRLLGAIERLVLTCDPECGNQRYPMALRSLSEDLLSYYTSFKTWRQERSYVVVMGFHRELATLRLHHQQLVGTGAAEAQAVLLKIQKKRTDLREWGGVAEVHLSEAMPAMENGLRTSTVSIPVLTHALLHSPNLQIRVGDGHPLTSKCIFVVPPGLLQCALKQFEPFSVSGENRWGKASPLMMSVMETMNTTLARHLNDVGAQRIHDSFTEFHRNFQQGFFVNVFTYFRNVVAIALAIYPWDQDGRKDAERLRTRLLLENVPRKSTEMVQVAVDGAHAVGKILTTMFINIVNHNLRVLAPATKLTGVVYQRLQFQKRVMDAGIRAQDTKVWLLQATAAAYQCRLRNLKTLCTLPPPTDLRTSVLYKLAEHAVAPDSILLAATFAPDYLLLEPIKKALRGIALDVAASHSIHAKRLVFFHLLSRLKVLNEEPDIAYATKQTVARRLDHVAEALRRIADVNLCIHSGFYTSVLADGEPAEAMELA